MIAYSPYRCCKPWWSFWCRNFTVCWWHGVPVDWQVFSAWFLVGWHSSQSAMTWVRGVHENRCGFQQVSFSVIRTQEPWKKCTFENIYFRCAELTSMTLSVNTNVSVCVYVYMRMKMSLNGFKLFRIINSKWFQQSTFSYLSSLIGSPSHILIILRIHLFSIKSMTILIWTFA